MENGGVLIFLGEALARQQGVNETTPQSGKLIFATPLLLFHWVISQNRSSQETPQIRALAYHANTTTAPIATNIPHCGINGLLSLTAK
jgi:hypothetical protein